MPLIFDHGRSLVPTATYDRMQLISLRDRCDFPDEAAVALIVFTHTATSGGGWRIADFWHPAMSQSTLLDDVDWGLSSDMKNFCAVNLGPFGANPEKYIWAGLYYGAVNIYCVGYLTYDEVVVFPEVTSANRSDYLLTPVDDGGSFGGNGFEAGNIWDIETMRVLDGKQPTGLIWDGCYDRIKCYPRAVAKETCNEDLRGPGAFSVHGFDDNGDVWCYGAYWNGDEVALMGYLHAPIYWHDVQGAINRAGFLEDGVEYEYQFPEAATYGIFHIPNGLDDWVIERTGQGYPHTLQSDTQSRSSFEVIAALRDDQTVDIECNESSDSVRIKMEVMGYFLRHKTVQGTPMNDIRDMEVTPPELYVAPDNVGSLYINYSIDGKGYLFSDVDDLVFYLSGGAANSDPDDSLGGDQSTTVLASSLHSLFDAGTAVASYVGLTQYRCLYLENTGAETARDLRIWVEKGEEGSDIEIGPDPAGINGTATSVANDEAAPTGVSFGFTYSEESCYTVPALGPGDSLGLWFKRTFDLRSGSTLTPDTASLKVSVLDDG